MFGTWIHFFTLCSEHRHRKFIVDHMSLSYSLTLNIPFETERQAVIASNSLSPDPILKASELTLKYSNEDNVLVCKFDGLSDRIIRVAASSVIDNIKTIIECMDDFDGQEGTLFE